MLAQTFSVALSNLEGIRVLVEAASQNALPQIHITGLAGEVVRESKERVRMSLHLLGFQVPTNRIVVHLSPSSTKKHGNQFDLAIAISILMTEGMLKCEAISQFAFLGELNLEGKLLAVKTVLPLVEHLENDSTITKVILPRSNHEEVQYLNSKKVYYADNLGEVIDFLNGTKELNCNPLVSIPLKTSFTSNHSLDSVVGQWVAKRALQIALAGNHHFLMLGPPGVGKSLIASTAKDLLPPFSEGELIEVLKIYSYLDLPFQVASGRPFRNPHHSISRAGLLGGGSAQVKPGEVSLAHSGVLFLDEFPEFRRDTIEGLREPMQNKKITINRTGHHLELLSDFTLIAAMNPCPCGQAYSDESRCVCSMQESRNYRKRISKAILDRMALCVLLTTPKEGASENKASFSFEKVKNSIFVTNEIQNIRYKGMGFVRKNGCVLDVFSLSDFKLDEGPKKWWESRLEEKKASFRKLTDILKVARTIADLELSDKIKTEHLIEAWNFRCENLS